MRVVAISLLATCLMLSACQRTERPSTAKTAVATETERANDFVRQVVVARSPAEWVGIPTAGEEELGRPSDASTATDTSGMMTSTAMTMTGTTGTSGTASTAAPRDVWKNTDHAFGYVGSGTDIVNAGDMEPDLTLKGKPIKITLQRLRVADYPGKGMHRILFDFAAKNQVTGGEEPLHFNQVYRAQEGGSAGIVGYPIFLGLNVGNNGVSLKAYTVNVSNDSDENLLQFLESDVMKDGLKLANTAQPALVPFSQMALNITRMIASRRRNVPVQDAFIGLDFDQNQHGARLRTGDYVVVQTPANVTWNWSEWIYDRAQGRIVNRSNHDEPIPYNYFVFGISLYQP